MTDWKIASFNANSIRARLPIVLDWLLKNQPDVLCLQETKVQDKEFPKEAFRQAGYHAAFRGEKAYNGVAIISQSAPETVTYGLGGQKDADETRLIAAVIDGIPVVNTYVPQGRDAESEYFQYKLKWFDRLLAFFKKNYSPERPLVWIGDVNVAPDDIDVHDPKGLRGHVDFHPEVQKKLQKIMAWGFIDVFRKHQPGPGQYSFWDYRVKAALDRGIGWRVDHIMATPPMAALSKDAWIDPEPRRAPKPSDHTPIVAEFRI
ncbi:MAG TPA: exodeoxyribonuclease III [bacterium]|nr:exodeoxyribonuclease III [bacterium]